MNFSFLARVFRTDIKYDRIQGICQKKKWNAHKIQKHKKNDMMMVLMSFTHFRFLN